MVEMHELDMLVELATQPFPNGCSWRLAFTPLKAFTEPAELMLGCYGGPYSHTLGAKLELLERCKPGEPLRLAPETVQRLLKRTPCPVCGAPFFKAPA